MAARSAADPSLTRTPCCVPAGQDLGAADPGRASRTGRRRCRRITTPRQRMLGVTENRILGPADQHAAARGRASGSRPHVSIAPMSRLRGAGRRARRARPVPIPYFGGEGPERATCIGLRRLHDGLPLQREEHAGPELPLPRRKARRTDFRRDPRRRCAARSTAQRTAARATRCTRSDPRLAFGSEPRRFTCRGVVFSASSLGTMDLLFRLKDKGSLPAISDQLGPLRAHQFRVADRRARARSSRRPVERGGHRLRRLHRRAHAYRGHPLSRRARTPWACWPRSSPEDALGRRESRCGSELIASLFRIRSTLPTAASVSAWRASA